MTWQQALQLLITAASALAGIAGVILVIRAATRTDAQGGGMLKQQVESLEKRVQSVESDMRELAKGQTDIKVAVAALPGQLTGLKEIITMQHEAATHSARNLRASVEALARKAGMLGPAEV